MGHSVLRQAAVLGLFAVITAVAAWLGGEATKLSVGDWYRALLKPTWTPPGHVIGTVWTVLYILMALAAWLVWRKTGFQNGKVPLALWGVQLAMNVLWTVLFFGLRHPGAAFTEIVALWAVILATMLAFFRVSTLAGIFFVPYLAWVTFAGYLNWLIYRMNGLF
jgi:tryptophan-rich sensory protein